MALPTKGRVIIDTTVGELDIELWAKETPRTCRNFIALAMEGYYDGVIFHRVVPDFLVQTGDRTGTGGGGESFYGEPFEDEIHPRLRYAHRGLVGMANNGEKNSNDSQFFITLDRADELHGKHTLFGRCVGDTIYNVMKIGALELDDNGKPVYPPKIKSIRIIENPFEDIVPRITAAEKRAQQLARERAQREREEEMRRKGAKKDVKLLSFQDEEEEEENLTFKKKAISRPDLIDNSEQLALSLNPDMLVPSKQSGSKEKSKSSDTKVDFIEQEKSKRQKEDSSIVGIREKHAKEEQSVLTERQKKIDELEKDIRRMKNKQEGGSDSEEERAKRKRKTTSYLDEEFARYEKSRGLKSKRDGKGKKVRDEGDILAKMSAFKSKIKGVLPEDDAEEGAEADEVEKTGEGEAGMEVDDDTGFLSHKLYFPKGNEEEVSKAERDYEVIDPRQRSARAREEEREKRRRMKPRDGGRGSRR
ncbi:cyclophilin-like protein [Schizopora paradoxa]|uniref:Cyclophilin-like protein n=1 Tax=Schizopora paradoxa TaxID=27342 RepID=A0A0H2R6M4_9AGAM|nr:cyclophilin-like protein [Schizopora paradoxa]